MKIVIPDTVKVAGHIVKVIKDHKFEGSLSECSGLALFEQDMILIATTEDEGDFSQDTIEEIFLHELLHHIAVRYLSKDLSENIITQLAIGLHQVLNDNQLIE